jgi:hypothetical protein
LRVRRTDSGKVRYRNNAAIIVILARGGDATVHACVLVERLPLQLLPAAKPPSEVMRPTPRLHWYWL